MQRSMLSNEVKSIKEGELVLLPGLESASLFNAVNKQVYTPLTRLVHASYTPLTRLLLVAL
jgi:hypothetical protein